MTLTFRQHIIQKEKYEINIKHEEKKYFCLINLC